jgi:hypothetical protein
MKKIAISIVVFAILAGVAFCFEPPAFMQQTATKTADAACATKAGYLFGVVVVTDGINGPSLDIYDNASGASGNKLVPTLVLAATPRVQTLSLDPPVAYSAGVYVDVTVGGGGSIAYMVYYRNR